MNEEPCKVLVVDEDRDNTDTTVFDLGRPIVNGFDLANELRRCCPEARLVAITAFTAADIVRRTRAAGFDKVLFKPAPAIRLQEAVESACALKSGLSKSAESAT